MISIKIDIQQNQDFKNALNGITFWKFGDKYGKKLMDTATKREKDAAKTASERGVQKTAEATGDLIGNKIADEITSKGKSKEN